MSGAGRHPADQNPAPRRCATGAGAGAVGEEGVGHRPRRRESGRPGRHRRGVKHRRTQRQRPRHPRRSWPRVIDHRGRSRRAGVDGHRLAATGRTPEVAVTGSEGGPEAIRARRQRPLRARVGRHPADQNPAPSRCATGGAVDAGEERVSHRPRRRGELPEWGSPSRCQTPTLPGRQRPRDSQWCRRPRSFGSPWPWPTCRSMVNGSQPLVEPAKLASPL